MRRKAKVDNNQSEIIKALRQIPGVTVEPGHDDILVGYGFHTFWFELKDTQAISRRTGEVKASEITPSEHKRLNQWTGHYAMVWTIEQILNDIGLKKN